jgi:hypothetical protein
MKSDEVIKLNMPICHGKTEPQANEPYQARCKVCGLCYYFDGEWHIWGRDPSHPEENAHG